MEVLAAMTCSEIQNLMLDSLEGRLQPGDEIKLIEHLENCRKCEDEMIQLQEITAALAVKSQEIEMPEDFMLNVGKRVRQTESKRKKKGKAGRIGGLAAAVCLALFAGTAAANGGFTAFKDWWQNFSTEESEQEQQYIQSGLGEKLDLEAESSGIKIRITSVAADDIQTLIYYEVENLKSEDLFMLDYDRIEVLNADKYWSNQDEPIFSPIRSQMNLYSDKQNTFRGKLSVAPMDHPEGNIELKILQLEKFSEASEQDEVHETLKGEWSFEVPVVKHPSIEYPLSAETETDGNPIIFEKLVIAPTATMLTYRYQNTHNDKTLDFIAIDSIETENGLVSSQLFGPGGGSSGNGWNTVTSSFDSIYGEKPKHIKIHLGALQYSVEEPKSIDLKGKDLPIKAEYKGNSLSIDSIEPGKPAKVVLTEELPENRAYEKLRFSIAANGRTSTGINSDGYFIDKNGQRYKADEYFMRTAELHEPRLYTTKHTINLSGDGSREVIPERLEIEGFSYTTFSSKNIKIELDGKAGH
ncbi:hypothetical protein CYJ37_03770 [Bacillus sp. UMB0728]|nr:hypothetical protein CYJ37_03770 [Bacillus sp. UMB0728]